MNQTSNGIEVFLTYLRETEQQYHMAEADEQEANDATQDLLHFIELEDHDHEEYARLSEELAQVKAERSWISIKDRK